MASPLADLPRPLLHLGSGLAAALLAMTCLPLRVMGEGMSFLAHEMGHALVSIFFGRFAVPAVVMTLTFEQNRLAAALIWAFVGFGAWKIRGSHRPTAIALGVLAALYPFFAFTRLHETLISLGGHATEIVIVAVFFVRAVVGGYFNDAERPIYAAFAWYLWIRNLGIFGRILVNAQFRETYLSVSFTGGDNDLAKVANEHGLALGTVSAGMLLLALALPVAALAFGAQRAKAEAATPDPYGGWRQS